MQEIYTTREHRLIDSECHHWEKDIDFLITQINDRNKELQFFFNKPFKEKRGG